MGHQRSGIFIIVAFQTGCSVARLFRIINNGISLLLNNGSIYIFFSGRLRIKSLPSILPLNNPQRNKGYLVGMELDVSIAGVSYSHQYSFQHLEKSSHTRSVCLI